MGSTKVTPQNTKQADADALAALPPQVLDARRVFVAALQPEAPGTDLPRYVAVLDALLAWSGRRAGQLVFRAGNAKGDVLRFDRTGKNEAFWSARVVRRDAPQLELHIPATRAGSAVDRAEVMRTLNAHSRHELLEGDRLRIGFGALKNAAALQAVLELMDRLLGEPTEPTPAA